MNAWAARVRAAWIRRALRRPRIRFSDRYGLAYMLRATDDLALYFRHRGWFEEAEQAFCARYLTQGMIAFDVGAYIGVYALLMAKLVGASGHVHAFEPSADSHARLLEHVRMNEARNVTVNRSALHARTGQLPLTIYGPPFESLTTFERGDIVRGGKPLAPIAEVPVETITIDDYCTRWSIERVDMLKLDVEGAESSVLEGAARLLGRDGIRCVLVEVGPGMHAVREVLDRHGFRFWTVAPDGTLRRLEDAPVRGRNVVALRGRSPSLT